VARKKRPNKEATGDGGNQNGTMPITAEDGAADRLQARRKEIEVLEHFKSQEFEVTGNPVYAIEAFLLARLGGRVPPENVLQWLARSFRKWLDAKGAEPLDRIMGLSVGKGGTPPYKAAMLRGRDETLYRDIVVLRLLGATIEEASHMVSRRAASLPESRNGGEWPEIAADTLAQKYKRWPDRRRMELFYKNVMHPNKWGPEDLRTYLEDFPTDSIPPRLRIFLRASPWKH
jgi:hypothetical protein